MRGLAVLSAAFAAWVIAAGRVPAARLPRLPRLSLRAVGSASLAGAGTWLLALGLTGAPVLASALALLAAAGPVAMAAVNDHRARAATADRWPDVLAVMRSRLAGGETVQTAFVAACAESGSAALSAEALHIEETASRGAGGFVAGLEELRARLGDPLADRVIATLIAATRSGGHRVSEIIGALGASVADELRLRKAHQAALTQQRLTAAVALVAPWLLLLLTVTTNPQAASAYRTPAGSVVVLGGLAATVTGYGLAQRTARLSRPPRVFQ